mmetsp:Transcript_40327/g.79527  ORF Transcript_40327/g.79527 Transcript_40327/m.79527 type:complete len:254 (-) Transcript_40327:373-1134(-)
MPPPPSPFPFFLSLSTLDDLQFGVERGEKDGGAPGSLRKGHALISVRDCEHSSVQKNGELAVFVADPASFRLLESPLAASPTPRVSYALVSYPWQGCGTAAWARHPRRVGIALGGFPVAEEGKRWFCPFQTAPVGEKEQGAFGVTVHVGRLGREGDHDYQDMYTCVSSFQRSQAEAPGPPAISTISNRVECEQAEKNFPRKAGGAAGPLKERIRFGDLGTVHRGEFYRALSFGSAPEPQRGLCPPPQSGRLAS